MAQPTTATTFLTLPAELRNIIYELAFEGSTTPRNERQSVRLEEQGLLQASRQIRAEALPVYLEKVKVVVLANYKGLVKGDNKEVAAALVPLLVSLEVAGFWVTDRSHQFMANKVAQELGRGREYRFLHRSIV